MSSQPLVPHYRTCSFYLLSMLKLIWALGDLTSKMLGCLVLGREEDVNKADLQPFSI